MLECKKNKMSARVVVKSLEEHPADLHMGANSLVLNALRLAFPCTE